MAVDISAEAVIARPASHVAQFATDPAHDPEWIGGVVEAQLLREGPVALGSQVRRVAKFLGRRINYTTEITEWQPPSRVVMSTTMPFPMTITYEFVENGGDTMARIRVQGEGSGFFKLAAPLLARQVRRNVTGDLKRLKALIEQR
jgi:uncharacterized protein YndB with AHSA1/START domain